MIKEMLIKLFKSVWFNVLLSVLAGFFGVMQEVWLGDFDKLNAACLGIFCAIGLSAGAEIIKAVVVTNFINTNEPYWWVTKNFLYGAVPGVLVALLCVAFA